MTTSELIALIAAVGGLLVAIGTATASVITALRMGRVETAVNGHSDVMRQLAGAQGFSRGVDAERTASGAALAMPRDNVTHSDVDDSSLDRDESRYDRHGNLLRSS
jgi:hypothetical protein